MQCFSELLNAVVDRTTFDIGPVQTPSPSRPEGVVSSEQFREIVLRSRSWHSQYFHRTRGARVVVPDDLLKKLCALIRTLCHEYVEPSTDRIGHAFPIRGPDSSGRHTAEASGVVRIEETSPVETFTKSIVRGATVLGTRKVTSLVSDWLQGKPISYHTRAVFNGVEYDTEPLTLMKGVRIDSLPLSTDQIIEFLPRPKGLSLSNYLGRMVLTIDHCVAPVLFRPDEQPDAKCRHTAVPNADFATVCQAFTLESDTFVDVALSWNDFNDLKTFALTRYEGVLSAKQARFGSRPYTNHTVTIMSGVTTLESNEGPRAQLDTESFTDILNALASENSDKFRMPVSRWLKSKAGSVSLTDKFIDLRITLESLFLKDFDPNTMGEISFKLAIFGAWYLGADFEERQNIRKKLRDAYGVSSRAVHSGLVDPTSKNQELLSDAQNLCRQGILKLLKEGAPNDWGDLILGGPEKSDLT